MIHKVGGYSLCVWLYLAWSHQDVEARDMEDTWKSIMGTGLWLRVRDLLHVVP